MLPVTTSHLSHFITFAHALADAAGEVIRPHFGAHGDVEDKADNSPVTIADKLAEKAMRKLISQTYPDHAIYGEEFGIEIVGKTQGVVPPPPRGRLGEGRSEHNGTDCSQSDNAENSYLSSSKMLAMPPPQPSPYGGGSNSPSPPETISESPIPNPHYTWVLDPIDGTRAFIAGRKEWGTLIALCENGVPILGILDQPITGERWVGAKGKATHYSSTPANRMDARLRSQEVTIHTRPCPSLADAELSTTSANYFTPTQAKQVVALAQSVRATVKDGDCYAYGLLASGLRDVVVDAGLKPYDILALVPIIEGAGGKITNWDGAPVTLEHYANVMAAGDAALHEEALDLLRLSSGN